MKTINAVTLGLLLGFVMGVDAQGQSPTPTNVLLPSYPPLAHQARIQGGVELNLLIEQGQVKGFEVITGNRILFGPLIDERSVLRKWEFALEFSGKYTLMVVFLLDDESILETTTRFNASNRWILVFSKNPLVAPISEAVYNRR